jgi:hypothetical protein
MQTIEIKTLIDITNTGVNRPNPEKEREFNQQRNWTTLMQCIGLRSIITYQKKPSSEMIELKGLEFGSRYKGKHRVWTFEFNTDRSRIYENADGPMGLLINDLHQVPVIKNINETINISKAVFDLTDPGYKNTTVRLIELPSENG